MALPEFLQAPPDFSRVAWLARRAGFGSGVEVPRSVSLEGWGTCVAISDRSDLGSAGSSVASPPPRVKSALNPQAKAHIVCDQTPPSGHTEQIFQDLSVWDGSWVTIAQNTSNCPSGTGSPSCYPNSTAPQNMMTAYVNEPREVGSTKHYLQLATYTLTAGGNSYFGATYNQNRVECVGP